MARCEDAPCCGCCGHALDRADYDAALERQFDYDDDPFYEEY